jgi:hypothetical protein
MNYKTVKNPLVFAGFNKTSPILKMKLITVANDFWSVSPVYRPVFVGFEN